MLRPAASAIVLLFFGALSYAQPTAPTPILFS